MAEGGSRGRHGYRHGEMRECHWDGRAGGGLNEKETRASLFAANLVPPQDVPLQSALCG